MGREAEGHVRGASGAVKAYLDSEGFALAASAASGLRVWCVYSKGMSAVLGDGEVRAAFLATQYRPPL